MAKIEDVKRCVLELIEQNADIEWTVRQMYYRLVSPPYQIIDNTRSNYVQFDKQLVTLREHGEVEDDNFVDTARRIDGGDSKEWDIDEYFIDVIERLKSQYNFFTHSKWKEQKYSFMVVLEKDALSRLVGDITTDFFIPLAVCRGYSSRTQILDIIDYIDIEKETKILYLGDFDPSGMDIERSLMDRFRKEGYHNIAINRISLTYQQVQDRNLPPNPTKIADTRSQKYVAEYGNECWELDAIPPRDLKWMVDDAIREYIDMEIWRATEQRESEGREDLKERFEASVELLKREFNLD